MTHALKHKLPSAGNDLHHNNSVDIVWGAEAIAAAIGQSPRQAYYLLEKGLVPGAGKMGARHYLSIPAFNRAVHGEAV